VVKAKPKGGSVVSKGEFCKRCPVGGTFNEEDQTCSIPDPDDGLPLSCVGPWAEEKHARLRKYVDISRAARRKFVNGRGGATYVDIYCGPGRARIRESSRIIDGSCVVAADEALRSNTPFTEIVIADANDFFVAAAARRLESRGVAVRQYVGAAVDTAPVIAVSLGKFGLHFAFLDPYDLKSLPFSVIEALASLERMDMLIHVSAQDLQRNLRRYIQNARSPLDDFAPGWRTAIDPNNSDGVVRNQVLTHWLGLIQQRNMQPSQGDEVVTGSNKQYLYWLMFVARHKLAVQFWEEIRNVGDQRSLGF
jgi:three-Cys-motif partner protein